VAGDGRVQAHWLKAEERLGVARELLYADHAEDAISRAYYAAFHAATAALLALGFEAKTHGGLRALFGLHVVQAGLAGRDAGRALEDLYDRRRRSDYEVTTYFTTEDAEDAVAAAATLLAACQQIIVDRAGAQP